MSDLPQLAGKSSDLRVGYFTPRAVAFREVVDHARRVLKPKSGSC